MRDRFGWNMTNKVSVLLLALTTAAMAQSPAPAPGESQLRTRQLWDTTLLEKRPAASKAAPKAAISHGVVKGALVGKVAGVFTSTGTGGGNESTIMTFAATLVHHGMIFVGLPYTCPELADVSEVKGGSPWGAATFAGADGSRKPTAKELAQARFQGRHIAGIAKKLAS